MVEAVVGVVLSTLVAAMLAGRGLRKGSLSRSGAAAACAIGTLHMMCGLQYGTVLYTFYLSSSKLTKWRSQLKAQLEEERTEGGRRGAGQVLANSLLGGLLAVAATWAKQRASAQLPSSPLCSWEGSSPASLLDAAFLGFFACCCGDTWSSEVGVASKSPPRLVTTAAVVPPGTNGGVTALGTAAAGAGGLFMGACYAAGQQLSCSMGEAASCCGGGWALLPLAAASGLAGSLLDSLLGATLQRSSYNERTHKAVSGRVPAGTAQQLRHISGRDVLSNTGVNVVASLATSLLAAGVASLITH